MNHPLTDITGIIQDWQGADKAALSRLLPLVLEELHQLAAHYLSGEQAQHTLQPTALVNEVYVRLMEHRGARIFNRAQFFAFTARLMRRILVDHARAKRSEKRGGGVDKQPLDEAVHMLPMQRELNVETLLALDQALTRLGQLDPRRRGVAELRYFSGLTFGEIAELLCVSLGTVERDWALAKRWLAREMKGASGGA